MLSHFIHLNHECFSLVRDFFYIYCLACLRKSKRASWEKAGPYARQEEIFPPILFLKLIENPKKTEGGKKIGK